MAVSNNFYPSIKDIVSDDLVPEQLSFIQNGIDAILNNLFYKDFQLQQNYYQDTTFTKITLVSYERIGFEFPGTGGLALILNPGIELQTATEVPLTIEFQLEILRYVRGFSIAQFAQDPASFYDLFLKIADASEGGLLLGLIGEFYSSDMPLDEFAADFNAKHGTSISVDHLLGNDLLQANDLVSQINQTNSFIQTTFEDFVLADSFEESVTNLLRLFKVFFGDISLDDIKRLLLPKIGISIDQITLALEFPRSIFLPLDSFGEVIIDENVKTLLSFDVGSVKYSTEEGFSFLGEGNFDFQKSQIGSTGFTLEITDMKLDLSREDNIPEAEADGRPVDFIGAYITEGIIGFPAFWNHDDPNSTGQIVARNLLVGTGGISGTLGLEAKTAGDPAPLVCAKFGQGFEVCLTAFSIDFQQNAIIGSDISGTMKVPGFEDASGNDAEIAIDIHIGQDGDFSVTATEPDGIPIVIPNVLQFNLTSAGIGRDDDRWFLKISGSMEFINPTVSTLFPAKVDFQEIIIWDDGQFEIKGGGLELPQALSLKFPPVELSVTAIHLGSTERDYDNGGTPVLRKYKYFGFDGNVKVDPGGAEAKGKGIQVYFSSDNSVLPLDIFVRIESLRIDIIIPGDADPKDASVIIAGFLSVKDPPVGLPGTEYAGGVSIDLPQAGIGGAAAMVFNPKVPYFIIDLEVEISKAIPLGSTGLGLYGFRGLLGKYYVATKSAAGVADSEPWWKYYKAKVANDYKEGVQISKFDPIGGFAVGLGVSLATATDGGKVFSSKIFLLLSLRELLLLQGQAAILKDRIQLNDPNDPPFFALIVITRESIEAALGVNYLIPDDKDPGSIATVQGVMELGFFFKDSSAWYLNIGRDLPESYRIQVRLFDLFDVYFYFMLNAYGIRTGAGASFELDKKFGPLRAYLYAYLDIAAKVAFKPKQLGGSIALGGGVELSIFGLGFGVSVAASLAAEAPEPFVITGSLEVCIKVLKKDRCAKFEFVWEFNNNVDTSEIGLIDRTDPGAAAQAVNIQTKETFAINFVKDSSGLIYRGSNNPSSWAPPAPTSSAWNGSFDDYLIPLDCFIDIDFKNGMNPNGNASTDRIGKNGGANHIRYVAPQKGKTPRVKHDFKVEDIFIYAWNPAAGAWEEYDIYDALTPMDDLPFIDPLVIDSLNLKQGYWQMEEANKYNKLRLLAQTPLSYMVQTSGEFIPENNGITSETIFCEEEPREKCCVSISEYLPRRKEERREQTNDFTTVDSPGKLAPVDEKSDTFSVKNLATVTANEPHFFKCFTFVMNGQDAAIVQTEMSHLGESIAIAIQDGDCLEILFPEPVVCIDFTMFTLAQSVTVEYYQLVIDPNSPSGLDVIEQQLPHVDVFTATDLNAVVQYLDPNNPVDKICIKNGECAEGTTVPELCDAEITMEAEQLEIFFSTLVSNNDLLTANFQLNDPAHNPIYDGVFMNSPLYQYPGGQEIPVNYALTGNTATRIDFVVSDENRYRCTFSLSASKELNWANITSMNNLRPDPNNLVVGENYLFLIDAVMADGTVETLSGKTTCYNIITCRANCSTYLFKLCSLSDEDYAYNQTIPGSSQVAAETQSMMDALEKTFQPIWRPNTTFAVAIKTNEAVSGGGSNNHRNTFYYGFRTKGPIGHFHSYLDDSNVEVIREDYQDLLDANREDAYQLSKLQHYVDYRRSYPNADGDLLNAKPLFYKDARLLLFFKKQYVYAMFGNWDALSGNGAVAGGMQVVIQDAIEPQVPPAPVLAWALDDFCIKGADVQAIDNMIQNSDPADCPPESLDQNSVNAQVNIDELEPLKLYTAIFSNTYQRDADAGAPTTTREVHRYPFRTSRYGNFTEQVNSYQLAIDSTTSAVLKTAIFEVGKVIPATSISSASGMISPTPNNDLLQDYADLIERVLQGAFKLGTLHPAISTEFNIVRNTDTGGNLLGIWIRCPEPFNDPKLPASEMQTTIRLSVDGDSESNYKAIFSKDTREVFVTNSNASLNMPAGEYTFTFDYREWDGQQYITVVSVPVTFTINASI